MNFEYLITKYVSANSTFKLLNKIKIKQLLTATSYAEKAKAFHALHYRSFSRDILEPSSKRSLLNMLKCATKLQLILLFLHRYHQKNTFI